MTTRRFGHPPREPYPDPDDQLVELAAAAERDPAAIKVTIKVEGGGSEYEYEGIVDADFVRQIAVLMLSKKRSR
jgi:hypothetical protein